MEFSVLLQHRIVFLREMIDAATANLLIGQLLLLDSDDPGQSIDLYINSPGGSVSDGLAIIDAMRCIQAPVATICVGKAYSMAAWILAAGTKGKRSCTPNAEMMIHQVAAGIQGEAADIELYARRIKRQQESLLRMLSEWSGRSLEQLAKDVQHDYYMTAEEALRFGLVDRILQPDAARENQS